MAPDPPVEDPDRTVSSDDPTLPSDHRGATVAVPTLPASIGNYTIGGKLGEGGMGVVYEAEQQSPRRKVALKVVRGGHLVTELSVKLFQREAETLGRLKHPGIGAIYESGRTAEGQHFFAMELVRGETLSRHVEKRGAAAGDRPAGAAQLTRAELSRDEIRYRLNLLRQICDAVNYAHQRGVIHRDLKPSNILITEDGEPKILDFGLARITDSDTEALSIVSEVGSIRGTLPYMSPEQTRGKPDEIDVRTDVYSLGVILYELLAGRLPYDTSKSSIVDAVRVITDESPAPFRSLTGAGKLAGSDLETIVRKALEKEADQRYASAAALSDDLERYLTDQPIQAVPPSTMYQVRKFVRRNRWGVGVAMAAVLALAAFAVASTVQARRVALARDDAQAQAARAEAMNTFLRDMLESADPWAGGSGDVTVAATLDAAVDEVGDSFAGQPLLEAEMRAALGNTYYGIGRVRLGLEQMSKALEIRTRLLGPDHPEVADVWMRLAEMRERNGDDDGAVEAAEEAVRIRLVSVPGPRKESVAAWNALAGSLWRSSRPAEAESVLALSEAMLASLEGDTRKLQADWTFLASNIALYQHNDLAGADSLRGLAVDLTRAIDNASTGTRLNDLALVRLRRGDLRSARELFGEALESTEARFGTDHPEYAMILENSGQPDYHEKRYVDVLDILERVREIRARNLGEEHLDVLRTRLNIAAVSSAAGQPERALATYDDLLPALRRARGELHRDIAATLRNRGVALQALRRNPEAEE
ncbi:MAG TPA: serine/threonine-protein kinase, partial [bacterium]|nr:serine/threonine-protein kinase [bacterium]